MPDHEAPGRAGEPPVGDQCDALAEARALQRAGHELHLAHPRPSLRAFVAQDHHVTGLDRALRDGGEGVFLPLEHTRRPVVG